MNVQYDLVVDFARPSKSNTIIVSEYDDKTRVCHFTLLNDKQPFSMAEVSTAYITGRKPDGSAIVIGDREHIRILEDGNGNKINEIEYTITKEITNDVGNITMQLTLEGGDAKRITSFDFYILVRNGLYSEDDMTDPDTVQGFRDLLSQSQAVLAKLEQYTEEATRPNPFPISITVEDDTVNYTGVEPATVIIKDVAYISNEDGDIAIDVDILEASSVEQCRVYAETCADAKVIAEEAIDATRDIGMIATKVSEDAEKTEAHSLEAEGWAIGQQNGEDVEIGSPYYHNNAKYWSEAAKGDIELDWNGIDNKPFNALGEGFDVENNVLESLSDAKVKTNIAGIDNQAALNQSLYNRVGNLENDKQNKLTEGTGIKIENDVISVTESSTDVSWTQSQTTGTKVASISIDGESQDVFVPTVPTQLSQLATDSTHRVVTDTEKALWNSKSDFNGSYNSLIDKPTIPSALSQLTADANHRTVTDAQIAQWNEGGSGGATKLNDLIDVNLSSRNANDILCYQVDAGLGYWTNKQNNPSAMNAEIHIPGHAYYEGTLQSCLDGMCEHIGTLEDGAMQYGTSADFEAVKDLLPVGSEYVITDDYDVAQNTNVYSLDEVLIGKFFGKNLYRRLWVYNQPLGTSTKSTTVPKAGMENIINSLWIRNGDRFGVSHPNVWAVSNNDYLQIDHFETMSLNSGETAYLAIDYTKVEG